MGKKHLLLAACLLCSGIVSAQSGNLFKKYADEDGVTAITISKSMFDIMGDKVDGLDFERIKGKIDNMRIITSDKKGLKEKIHADFKSSITEDESYEELMTIKDGKSDVTFNARKNGGTISELIMLVNDEEDFVAIQVAGNFTLEDIQNFAKQNTQ